MISNNLHNILIKRNITLEQLASRSQVPLETIRNIIYHKAENPRINTMIAITQALNITVEELTAKAELSNSEKLIADYTRSGSYGKRIIELIASIESELSDKERLSSSLKKIPCMSSDTALYDGIPYRLCYFTSLMIAAPEPFFAVKMSGNNYAPRFCHNDILLFVNRFPRNGENAIFYHDGLLYMRCFVQSQNEYQLITPYDYKPPIILKRMDSYQLVGTFNGVLR